MAMTGAWRRWRGHDEATGCESVDTSNAGDAGDGNWLLVINVSSLVID